jgi:hypothetical protein
MFKKVLYFGKILVVLRQEKDIKMHIILIYFKNKILKKI